MGSFKVKKPTVLKVVVRPADMIKAFAHAFPPASYSVHRPDNHFQAVTIAASGIPKGRFSRLPGLSIQTRLMGRG
jgi:hypothetical protein